MVRVDLGRIDLREKQDMYAKQLTKKLKEQLKKLYGDYLCKDFPEFSKYIRGEEVNIFKETIDSLHIDFMENNIFLLVWNCGDKRDRCICYFTSHDICNIENIQMFGLTISDKELRTGYISSDMRTFDLRCGHYLKSCKHFEQFAKLVIRFLVNGFINIKTDERQMEREKTAKSSKKKTSFKKSIETSIVESTLNELKKNKIYKLLANSNTTIKDVVEFGDIFVKLVNNINRLHQ